METSTRHLKAKFDAARALFERAPAAGVAGAAALAAELGRVETRHALAAARHFLAAAAGGEAARAWAGAEYARVLAAEDYAGATDRLVAAAAAALAAADARAPARGDPKARAARAEARRLLDVYPGAPGRDGGAGSADAGGAPTRVEYDACAVCGGGTAVDAARSQLRCRDGECGATRELVGTVFDESQFYNQEGQKAKSGTFNPNRHFQFWWVHILAREPEEEIGDRDDPNNLYGERLLEELRHIVERDRKVLRLLTVNDMRAMLRETGRTDLNKNVSLLLRRLTGVGPPAVAEALTVRVENLFTKAIEVGERLRRGDRVNRNYYPFYIAKILEQLVPESDRETRRILYYIYTQSKETVESDDADWERICDELGEIAYVPTDRTLGSRYGAS